MDLNDFRNTMREWIRAGVQQLPVLAGLDLVVPNQAAEHGVDDYWLRYSMQLSSASVIGVGTAIKRRRRTGRVYLEVFGPADAGEGQVTQTSTLLEQLLRAGTDPASAPGAPDPSITLFEPSTFERPEAGRYCQVVTAPVQVDLFS